MSEINRVLGQLEEGVGNLKEGMERLLDGQDRIRAESEESRRRLYDRIARHEAESSEHFRLTRESIDALGVRVAQLEPMQDAMESHGAALLDLEKRIADFEADAKSKRIALQANRRWVKGLIAGVGALIGDHFTGGRLFKWIASLFKP
jgi:hypothetical protein